MDQGGMVAEASRVIQADCARVFDAWVTPNTARKFFFATPAGEVVRAELDARAGGAFVMTDRREGKDFEHVGRYLEVDRPRRLGFEFHVRGLGIPETPMTPVRVEFKPEGTGCRVTVQHTMAADWAAFKPKAEEGWGKMLLALERAIQGLDHG